MADETNGGNNLVETGGGQPGNVDTGGLGSKPESSSNPPATNDNGNGDDDDDDLFGENEEEVENNATTGTAQEASSTVVTNSVKLEKWSTATEPSPAQTPSHTNEEKQKTAQVKSNGPDVIVKEESSLLSVPKKIKDSKAVKKDVVSGLAPPASAANNNNNRSNAGSTTGSAVATSSTGHISGSIFGLSDAVRIPKSVDTKLLEGGILAKLKALPSNLANDALQEYDDALQIKGGSIRNQGAYLYGVIKRYTSVHERATTGGEGAGILPMGEGLTSTVNSKLETLVSSGFCTRAEMNEKVKSKIRMLSEKDALFAIDELSSTDRSSIRNFGSFFMGILNRYMRGDTQSRHDNPALHPPSSFNSSSSSLRPNRFDRNSSHGHRDRSRDRGPTGPPPPPPNRREYGGRGGGHPQNRLPPNYDPRQQQQQQQKTPAWFQGSAQPPPQQSQQQNMGFNSHGGPPPQFPPQPYQQQQPPPNQFVPPNGGYGQPNMGPGMPPQQPPAFGQMPPNSGYPPQQPPPQMMGQQQPPPQHPAYNPGNQAFHQQQPYNNGPMGQMQQPPPPPQQQQRPAPYGGWQQQPAPQQQQGAMLDILALADKASSAVQALASQNPPSNAQGQYGQQQHPYNAPPPQRQYQQPQSASFPPPPQQQPPPGFGMPPSAQQQPFGRGQQQQRQAARGNRHTTAKVEMLPPHVQYALNNLIATGQVERMPDDGIIGMIFDLPEGLALASLQKFATIDKSSMRNRIAYLAGLLRRELENINRR